MVSLAAPAADPAAPTTSLTKSNTSLATAKKNLTYLLDPTKNPGPAKRRTRYLLRTFRYIAVFLFWRLIRYAKYAAVGAVTAAVAGTAIGSVASGAAFVIAPTGIFAGAGVGLLWGMGKLGWRVFGRRVWSGDAGTHASAKTDEEMGHRDEVAREASVTPPRVEPW